MTLIQIYLIGVCTEALYIAFKWLTMPKEKALKFKAMLEAVDATHSGWWAIPLMCLLWPYNLLIAFLKMIGK